MCHFWSFMLSIALQGMPVLLELFVIRTCPWSKLVPATSRGNILLLSSHFGMKYTAWLEWQQMVSSKYLLYVSPRFQYQSRRNLHPYGWHYYSLNKVWISINMFPPQTKAYANLAWKAGGFCWVNGKVLAWFLRKGLKGLVYTSEHQHFPLVSEKSTDFFYQKRKGCREELIRISLQIKDKRFYLVICSIFCHTAITVLEKSLPLGEKLDFIKSKRIH